MADPAQIKKLAIQAALEKMMRAGSISICTIDTCLKLAERVPPREEYQILHALHCVHFADMDRELLQSLPTIITKVFELGIEVDWIRQLLGGGNTPSTPRLQS